MAFCGFWPIQRQNDILILSRLIGDILQVFSDGFSGYGQAVAVQEPGIQHHFHHLRNATGMVQVDGNIFS